jgi:hypothetical protein
LNHFEDVGAEYGCCDKKFESIGALLALFESEKMKEAVVDEW